MQVGDLITFHVQGGDPNFIVCEQMKRKINEVAFSSCLGKAKDTSGAEAYLWYGGFLITCT